ncbi:hypothetical protein BY458DRAFT_431450 [Sporodiniella umbellata]|nr:hypothetical protein BY458DRAFT_431450 [Sporodiniella umbellata]
MDKDTFIKRTKYIEGGEGVAAEILDVIYDNIITTEFTYANAGQQRFERSNSWLSRWMGESLGSEEDVRAVVMRGNPLLVDLGPKLEQQMPAENSFNYKLNLLKPIPIGSIHFSHLTARAVCLTGVRSRHGPKSTDTLTVRVTKAGVLDRKYDLQPGGKRATLRGWRPFGVILSGSQLIFFSDLSSYQSWQQEEQQASKVATPRRNSSVPLSVEPAVYAGVMMPSALRPTQIVSLAEAVCVHDESYQKYPYVFRLVTGDDQQWLLRATSPTEMDDWMLKINYAAALKTTGVVIRPFKRRDTTDPDEARQRAGHAREKIQGLSHAIEEHCRRLDRALQLRRNLMVLLPCQRSTRDRLMAYAEVIGKRMMDQRIQLQRLECYRDFLEAELAWSITGHPTPKHHGSFKSLSNLLVIPSQNPADLDRLLRRRSQSHPILPNLTLSSARPARIQEETNDDDALSVITVHEEVSKQQE